MRLQVFNEPYRLTVVHKGEGTLPGWRTQVWLVKVSQPVVVHTPDIAIATKYFVISGVYDPATGWSAYAYPTSSEGKIFKSVGRMAVAGGRDLSHEEVLRHLEEAVAKGEGILAAK